MAGYLDQYGAGDERREKTIKRVVISLVALAIAAGLLFLIFHNYRQERQAKRFFQLLAAHDYQAAYALWGCTAAQPCRDYPLTEFMRDWGPESVPAGGFDLLDAESCGSGVIVDVDTGKAGDRKLWIERDNLLIGYPPPLSPDGRCPQRNRISEFLRGIKYRLHGRTLK